MAPTQAPLAAAERETFNAAFDDFVTAARRARHRQSGGEGELSPAQYGLLAPLLHAAQAPGVRELAETAGVSSPTATRMLDGLERRGLVTRERCETDRRAVRIGLTAAGLAAVRAGREQRLADRRTIFESLDARERRAAASVLSRLAQAFEEVGR